MDALRFLISSTPAFWAAPGGPASPEQLTLGGVLRSSAMIVGAGLLPARQSRAGRSHVSERKRGSPVGDEKGFDRAARAPAASLAA